MPGRILALFAALVVGAAAAACGPDVKMVEVDPPQVQFKKTTQSEQIEAKALDMLETEVPGVQFTYESEDTSVATVDADGTVKPVGDGNTWIHAKTKEGVEGTMMVKVCLPKELECDPADELKLKVGTAGPIKCRVLDCDGEPRRTRIEMTQADEKMLLKEGDNVFIGLAVGDTEVTVKAEGMEKTVKVHIDEQEYLPGMGPGSGGKGGGKGRRGGGGGEDSAYGDTKYDHILDNMKFTGD